MRLYRKLNANRVIKAMEKADPTCRVSLGYNKRGRAIFTKRPKTERELELEKLIEAAKIRVEEKTQGVREKSKNNLPTSFKDENLSTVIDNQEIIDGPTNLAVNQ